MPEAPGAVDLDRHEAARDWRFALAVGVALMILGVAAVLFPVVATVAAELVIGAVLLLAGVFEIVAAFWRRGWPGFLWMLAGGALALIAGTLLLAFPLTGVLTLTLVVGVFFLAQGALRIAFAWRERRAAGRGWWLAGGILAVLLGALILVLWPEIAAWLLGVLVGVDLIVSGWRNLSMALGARRPGAAAV